MEFSKRLDLFGEEIFAELNNKRIAEEAKGRKFYNLSVGTPDFVPFPHIKEALISAAAEDANWKYALRDIPELLEAVCSYYKRRFGVETITPEQVMTFNGSQDGIGHMGLALLNDGDTVLLPDPCYPVFMTGMRLGGGVPYFYKLTKENGFLPNVSEIPEDIAKKAKLMIVSLPANPVGSVGTPELYAEIIAFCRKYDILLVHDNAYSDIIFDGVKGGSIFNYRGAEEIAVEFFSLSKSFNVTGARISFLVGRSDVIAACKKLRTQIDFGMFLPIQKAAVAALTGPLDGVKEQCGVYEARRNAFCGGLREIGWEVPDSHGSMFVWAPLPEGYSDSMEFCMTLMERAGVICTPGKSFGPSGEGYVRFALTLPAEELKKAVSAIRESGILS
ncbi:MAG: aminotransferase class I/II-fold pyridoxal phosphate-dependent enzyme [Eubacteriales bacterium]|nr:aminotransferase class I/II-fold pyridoxal phosphate-dependent enzyme [Eubacteriales bacterium]